MNELDEELQYEQKMDRITEQLEELVLDAVLSVLEKIKKRNLVFSTPSDNVKDARMQF
jgi:hypothetical protein